MFGSRQSSRTHCILPYIQARYAATTNAPACNTAHLARGSLRCWLHWSCQPAAERPRGSRQLRWPELGARWSRLHRRGAQACSSTAKSRRIADQIRVRGQGRGGVRRKDSSHRNAWCAGGSCLHGRPQRGCDCQAMPAYLVLSVCDAACCAACARHSPRVVTDRQSNAFRSRRWLDFAKRCWMVQFVGE